MNDGLKDIHRKSIVSALATNDRVERVVLFGSRAMGTHTMSSDVDVVLFGDQLTLTDQARLSASIEVLPMAQSVNLVLYTSIQCDSLLEHIRRFGIEWYVQPPIDTNTITQTKTELSPSGTDIRN